MSSYFHNISSYYYYYEHIERCELRIISYFCRIWTIWWRHFRTYFESWRNKNEIERGCKSNRLRARGVHRFVIKSNYPSWKVVDHWIFLVIFTTLSQCTCDHDRFYRCVKTLQVNSLWLIQFFIIWLKFMPILLNPNTELFGLGCPDFHAFFHYFLFILLLRILF